MPFFRAEPTPITHNKEGAIKLLHYTEANSLRQPRIKPPYGGFIPTNSWVRLLPKHSQSKCSKLPTLCQELFLNPIFSAPGGFATGHSVPSVGPATPESLRHQHWMTAKAVALDS